MKKKTIVTILIVIAVLSACSFCYWQTFLKPYNPYEMFWKPVGFEPLPQDVLSPICEKMKEISSDEICMQKDVQTEQDIYLALVELVTDGYLTTYDEWDAHFGSYEDKCNIFVNIVGIEYYQCFYDFDEDPNFYRLTVFFFSDGELMEVRPSRVR